MDSLSIKNYKNLENLQIHDLGRINLITGENNIGKSSLLEGISILQAGGRIDWLKQLLESRGESTDFSISSEDRTQKEMERFLSFVPDFDEKNMFDLSIEFSGIKKTNENLSESKNVTIRFVQYTETDIIENGIERTIRNIIDKFDINNIYDNLGVGLEITTNNQKTLYPFHGGRVRSPLDKGIPMQYIRMGDTKREDNPSLFDRLALTPLQKSVVKALQIIEPRIIDLNFLIDEKKRRVSSINDDRIPYIVLDGENKPRRLGSMGDGVNRILTIILAMLNCKNGILLIDEFENGLHYSIQRKLWKVIFDLAEELNIQVFATTHSSDTIRSFADENNRDHGTFIRLEHHKNKIQAITFSKNEDLSFILNQNIEIR